MLKKALGILMVIIDISVLLSAILLIRSGKADADEYIYVILWVGGLAMSTFALYSFKKAKGRKTEDSSGRQEMEDGDGFA